MLKYPRSSKGGKWWRKRRRFPKADLVDLVSDETQMKKKDVKTVIDAMIDNVTKHLNGGDKVQLTGFGTFEVRERKARTGVKPGTTEKN